MPRPFILICLAVYGAAMFAVHAFAKGFVSQFGATGGLLLIFAMYAVARSYDRRQDQRR